MRFFRKKHMVALLLFLAFTAGKATAANKDFEVSKSLEVLFNLFREVNANYVDTLNPDDLMKNAAEGMLKDLDPYTEFLSSEEAEKFEILTTGKYGGIGAVIRQTGEWVEIAEPYKGFAADKAGLKIGDRIVAIDGKEMHKASTEDVSKLMKGDPGTKFRLTVKRFEDGTEAEHTIRRERVVIPGVPYYGMINDSVGYILHDNFSEDCSGDIRRAFEELKKRGMKSLVYDLRNNGGGIMQEAVKIVSMFVPKGSEVVSTKGRAAQTHSTLKTTTDPVDTEIKIAVLIGQNSASAAEIVAGALQDTDRAVLLGQRSFGKGLVQAHRPIGYNSYVKMTTAKYYIPSGRCVQAVDYSHANEDGSVGNIPDSLIQEFTTRNGRKVYDGGGIMPDIKVGTDRLSVFTISLYAEGFLDDFAAEYIKGSGFKPVDLRKFRLSDEDYAGFVEFMKDKDVKIDSETKLALNALKRNAEKEKYTERIEAEIKAIEEKISKSKDEELQEFKDEIKKIIEDEIVLYYHYSSGVAEHNIDRDETITEALKVLGDPGIYNEITTTRDTARN